VRESRQTAAIARLIGAAAIRLEYGTAPAMENGTARGCQVSYSISEGESAHEPRLGRSVSIDQAAQLLGLSRRTIYNRIKDGRLVTIRTMGGSQRVLMESLYEMGFRPQAFPTSASAASFALRPVTRN
jgi:excisionase family DNA binding protein